MEPCALEVRDFEVRALEVGVLEVRVPEIGAYEVRSLEVGEKDGRALEVGASEVTTNEDRSTEISVAKIPITQIGRRAEILPCEVLAELADLILPRPARDKVDLTYDEVAIQKSE